MTSRLHAAVLVALLAAVLAVLLAAPGCVPTPRTFSAGPRPARLRVAILPLANYSEAREAPNRVTPMLLAELGRMKGIEVLDPGAVDAVLSRDPWVLTDRVPPDLVDRFGTEMGAGAILVGSVLGCGQRESGGEQLPQFSLSLRLLAVPGGRVLWSAVQSRDGADGEWLFGFGRVRSLEQLEGRVVKEILSTFPGPASREMSLDSLAAGDRR